MLRPRLAAWMLLLLVGPLACRGEAPCGPRDAAFTPVEPGPIFSGAGVGRWDAQIRERGWIQHDSHGWRMWYTGYDGTREGVKRLGLATSDDGIHWRRDERGPLVEGWVEDVMVVPHGDRLYMFAEGENDEAQLLVSDDGVHWERRGRLDVRLANGDPIPPGPFGTPVGYFEKGVWHLFYERGDRAVWLAASTDLQVWRNVSDEAVLKPGPEPYDRGRIAMNQVVKRGDEYLALYHATDDADSPALWVSCVATSKNLRDWKKCPGNPLFPKSADRSSDILVPLGDGSYRLYTMHKRVEAFSLPPSN